MELVRERGLNRGFTVCEGVEVTNIVACVTGAKRGGEGRGREKSAQEGTREWSLTLSPQSPFLFSFLPIPFPFQCCYAGYEYRITNDKIHGE